MSLQKGLLCSKPAAYPLTRQAAESLLLGLIAATAPPRKYRQPCFLNEETKAQRGRQLPQGQPAQDQRIMVQTQAHCVPEPCDKTALPLGWFF